MTDESQVTEAPSHEVKRSTRDPIAQRRTLRRWLAGRMPDGASPEISELTSPSATGMSSETLLFDARWLEGGEKRVGSFVARIEPDGADCPVFPVYDLKAQFELLKLVGERTRVPVPGVRWLELDPSYLGAPFFVMDQVEGRVPPDVMPYTFGSWLSEGTPEERRQLQDSSVGVLCPGIRRCADTSRTSAASTHGRARIASTSCSSGPSSGSSPTGPRMKARRS